MAGDIKLKYAASSALTVTNLHSLAASVTMIAGWTSNTIVNTSNVYLDYMIGAKFVTHASNRQAGVIAVYAVAALNDTPDYPATAIGTIGTEGTLGFADLYRRDNSCRTLAYLITDNTASAVYSVPQTSIASLFGGSCPTHFAIFVTQNVATSTNAGLAASGSEVYSTPVLAQYT
jgi:hypothetical protein